MNTIGYYVTCDDALCIDCARNSESVEPHAPNPDYPWWLGFEDWQEPIAIFGDTESDNITHCDLCGAVIEHDLTDDGYHAIIEAVLEGFTEGKQSPVVVQWLAAYQEHAQDVLDGEYFDTRAGTVEADDAMTLYALLPRDDTWAGSDDERLHRHVVLAGWVKP